MVKTRMTIGLMVLVAVSSAAALNGCSDDSTVTGGSTTSVPSSALRGTGWALATVKAGSGMADAIAGTPAGISFTSATDMSGDTTCNIFNGTYTASSGSLQLKIGPMTQRACVDPANTTQERNVIAALQATKRYSISGDVLTLMDGSRNPQATYHRVSTDLPGTTWKLQGLNTGNAVLSSAAVEAYTIAFATDRTLTAKGTCGTVTGQYSSDGRSFEFTGGKANVEGCSPDDTLLANQVLHALTISVTTEHTPGSVTFRAADGSTQLVLNSA
jgi:heat shock protein HslJ